MAHHRICFTIDTDPDGLAGQVVNRETLTWRGLERIRALLDARNALESRLGTLPITWFLRADTQIRDAFGSPLYLWEKFEKLWTEVRGAGDEMAWHPHLYRTDRSGAVALITDPVEAVENLEHVWETLCRAGFRAAAFRNGEGWHSAATLDAVERLGFRWDCSAVPGRTGGAGHPMNWIGTPNRPYFPDKRDIRLAGDPRPLLEIPLNTWKVKAPYDEEPRVRYINPAVHEDLFAAAADLLGATLDSGPRLWSFILHPDEVLRKAEPDPLYGRSVATVCRNLETFARVIRTAGHDVEFATISDAGDAWLKQEAAA